MHWNHRPTLLPQPQLIWIVLLAGLLTSFMPQICSFVTWDIRTEHTYWSTPLHKRISLFSLVGKHLGFQVLHLVVDGLRSSRKVLPWEIRMVDDSQVYDGKIVDIG